MNQQDVMHLAANIGIVAQLLIDTLLVLLFALLRRHSLGRPWFRLWTWSWAFLAIALCAVAASYFLLPPAPNGTSREFLQVTYLCGKFLFVLYLFVGYVQFARDGNSRFGHRYMIPAGVVLGLTTYALAPGIHESVLIQTVVSVICFVTVAIMLYRLPVRRKTLGSRLSMTVFLLMATLWVVYAFGFSPSLRAAGGLHNVAIGFVARMNGFFDLGTHIVLAFGMVLILLEEAKREVDAAHARLGVAHRRLRDQSLRDPLTGALNRRAFENNVGLEQVANGGAVLVLDLDNLKQTNDTYGHVAGDRLLESLANLLDEGLRDSDSLYRWGGDEFLLIMPGAHAATVRPRIQEQVDRFGQCRIPDGTTLQLEVSIGGTDFVDESALESAIGRADEAMYEHKRERKRSVEAAGENG